jgi:hypothetical protein
MTSVVSSSSASSYYAALFSAGTASNWLADAFTAIQNQKNQGGIFGMLQNAGGDGSINSFLGQSATAANQLALISQNGVTNAGSLYAQIAAQTIKDRNDKITQDALDALARTQQAVLPKNVLDPVIYMPDGTTIDTTSNIMTRPDGKQYDVTTGTRYFDPASIIQLANGAYLDTKNNILTMADGTQIDTITGLKVSTTA